MNKIRIISALSAAAIAVSLFPASIHAAETIKDYNFDDGRLPAVFKVPSDVKDWSVAVEETEDGGYALKYTFDKSETLSNGKNLFNPLSAGNRTTGYWEYGFSYKIDKLTADFTNFMFMSSIMKNIDVSVSLDIFGEVVWISNSDVPLEGYAYLIKSTKDDFGEALLLTYYDFDTNAVAQNVSTNSSVRFVNQKGESIKANSDGLAEILSDYDGVIKIIKDEDGLIKKIELPKNSDSDDPNALKLILESNNQTSSENYKGKLSYNNWSNAFGGKKYINSNTKILNVPVDKNDLSYYKITNSLEAGDYLFKLYSFDAESPYTKIAIVYKEKTMTYFDTLHGSVNTYFVMNRQETLNSDDEVGVKLTLYDGSSTQEFFAVNEDDGKSAFDKAIRIQLKEKLMK